MSYSFCFGPSGAGKSHYLRQMIIKKARRSLSTLGKDRTKYIVIVPEQYSMQTQHELILEDPGNVLMNVDVLSFGRLAHRVFQETGEDSRAVLDDIGKSLLLRRAASGCLQDLQILKRGIHSPGMIDEIKSVLSEFMQYGIGEEQIGEMASFAGENNRNALQARLKDIQKLYSEFQKAKEDRYLTSEETLDLLAKAVPKSKNLQGSVIVFDGFTGFTTVQYRVVTELIRCAKEVIFSFTVSGDPGPDISVSASGGPEGREEYLFYLSRKTVRDIVRIASKEGLPRGKDIYLPLGHGEEDSGENASGENASDKEFSRNMASRNTASDKELLRDIASRNTASGEELFSDRAFECVLPRFRDSRVLAHLEKNLFRYPERPFEEVKAGETAESLRIIAAPTPREEVRRIYNRISEMIARTGCAYRDFAIVTADLETYGDLFALEASRTGIPVYVDRTSGAFHNILIEGIRSVLQISSESFSYASVFRYLRSGLSRLTAPEVDLLENYCLANGVRGRKKWRAPFDADCEAARIKFLQEVEPVTGSVISTGEGDAIPRRARTAAERTRELYSFLVGIDAQGRTASLSEKFGSEGDVVREKQYSQIYQKVIDLLDQVYDLAGAERISASDYLELLEAGMSQIRLGTLPQRVDRVLVGDIERTRLTQIRHLFIAGVNEGSIPRSASRGGILSDMDREFLSAGGNVLAPTPRQQMFIQRLYLYLNMTKPSDTLQVSFAKVSPEGKSLRPSYLVSMLRSLFPLVPIEETEMLSAGSRVMDRAGGESVLAELLRRFVEGTDNGKESANEFSLLYGFHTSPEVMADPQVRRAVNRLRSAALFRYKPEFLTPETARAVYGNKIYGGISRMETGARCMLRHHIRYGLHLRERDMYEFQPVDEGTVLHGALNRFDGLLRTEGLTWDGFSREDALRLAKRALLEEAANYRNLLIYKSSRDESRLGRFERRLLCTVDTLQYQLKKGDFIPRASELAFGGGEGEMPPIRYDLGGGRELVLNGRIDRVDYCEQDGKQYIKIMDYKTGKRDLDPDQIRRGLQLQLITYMEALMRGTETVPSAMLYYHIADPVVNVTPEEALSILYFAAHTGEKNTDTRGSSNEAEKDGGNKGDDKTVPENSSRMDAPGSLTAGQDATGADAGDENNAAHSDSREQLHNQADEKRLDKVRNELRPTGLVYDDEESIFHLDKFFTDQSDVIPVKRKKDGGYTSASRVIDAEGYKELAEAASEALCRLANEILDGDVTAAPAIIDKKSTACDYCPYRDACGFDPRVPGFRMRRD